MDRQNWQNKEWTDRTGRTKNGQTELAGQRMDRQNWQDKEWTDRTGRTKNGQTELAGQRVDIQNWQDKEWTDRTGNTTSKSGQMSISTRHRWQPKTDRGGNSLRHCHQRCPNDHTQLWDRHMHGCTVFTLTK